MKVQICNFQSLTKADLEFVPGLNLIVGESNSGKTAILRAILAAVLNQGAAKHFIQFGKKSASVTIEIGSVALKWIRRKDTVDYQVTQKGGVEEHKKAGRDTAFSFVPGLPFFEDRGSIVNISGEWDTMFPFDRTPSELFKLFESMIQIGDSKKAFDIFKADEGEIKAEIVECEQQISINDEKVSVYRDALSRVDVGDLERVVTELEEVFASYKVIKERYASVTDLVHTLRALVVIPDDNVDLSMFDTYSKLVRSSHNIRLWTEQSEVEIPEFTEDLTPFDEYAALVAVEKRVKDATVAYSKVVSDLKDTEADLEEVELELKEFKTCPLCGATIGECADGSG